MNLRDDRVEAFGAIKPGEMKTLIYVLRAVSAGDFLLPPVEVQGMYDPKVWARDRVGRTTVRGPWAELID